MITIKKKSYFLNKNLQEDNIIERSVNISTSTFSTSSVTGISSDFVKKSGDTMSGVLNLPSNGLNVGDFQLICKNGNVGIGTNSPEKLLHVIGASEIQGNLFLSGNFNSTKEIRFATYYQEREYQQCNLLRSIQDGFEINLNAPVGQQKFWLRSWDNNISKTRLYIDAFGTVGINTESVNTNYKLNVNGGIYIIGNSVMNGRLTSANYISGFAGQGWAILNETDTLEIQNLVVRGRMDVYELVINQIRATNGSLWVSDSLRINGYDMYYSYSDILEANTWEIFLFWDTDDGNLGTTLQYGDVILCKKFTGRNVKEYYAIVYSVEDEYIVVHCFSHMSQNNPPDVEEGDVIVRIGNLVNSNRRGAIYITSSDNNAPFIDVIDGVTWYPFPTNVTKVRLGKLNGITDSLLGTLSGYGIYSNNAYLTGRLVLPNAGMTNEGTSGDSIRIWAGTTYSNRSSAPFRVTQAGALYATNANVSGTISASSGTVGGLTIASNYLYYSNSGISAVSGTSEVRFWAGSTFANRNSAPFRVLDNGTLYATNANVSGTINSQSGNIAGFNIANGYIGVEGMEYSGMKLCNDYIKFSDNYTWAGIGTNVFPSTSGIVVTGRFENNYNEFPYSPNIGIFVSVQGSYYNHAIYAIGDEIIVGNHIDILYGTVTPPQNTVYILGSSSTSLTKIFAKFIYSNSGIGLPTQSSVREKFGLSSNTSFMFRITFIGELSSTTTGKIFGRNTVVSGMNTNDYFYIVDNNGNLITGDGISMGKGDVLEFMLYSVNSSSACYAFLLNQRA